VSDGSVKNVYGEVLTMTKFKKRHEEMQRPGLSARLVTHGTYREYACVSVEGRFVNTKSAEDGSDVSQLWIARGN